MNIARRSIVGAAAAVPVFAIGYARAADYNFRLPHDLPATHPLHTRTQQAADRIRDRTGGRVAITLYPDSVLGSDVATITMLQAGTVDLFTLPGVILSSAIPMASLNGVGFAFSSYPRIWSVMDGPLGKFIAAEISRNGIIPVCRIANNGFRQSTSAIRPVVEPGDFKGLKLRVPASPLSTRLFQALGAETTVINYNLLYNALKTRAVDSQETPLALIEVSKLYEVQTYCSLTNHMWDGYWMLANEAMWRGLPDAIRDTIAEEFDRAALEERADLQKRDPAMRSDLAEAGLQINATETALFRRALHRAGFYNEWREKFGAKAWAVLEDAAGGLD